MKQLFAHRFTCFSCLLFLLLFACDDGAGTEDPNYTALIDSGWDKFVAANYSGAILDFAEAKTIDESIPTAFTGLGWSYLLQKEYIKSLTEFNQGLLLSDTIPDLYAGKAFMLNARASGSDYANSISAANAALDLHSNWIFTNGLSLNHVDLIAITAQAQFALGQFSASLASVKKIEPSFSADVSTPEGRAALQAKIEDFNASLN